MNSFARFGGPCRVGACLWFCAAPLLRGQGSGEAAPLPKTWAFSPPVRTAPPAVADPDWAKDPIDAFVLARLEAEGLSPSPPADRRTLIRRATLDVTGLPPTPEEVAAFVADEGADAYERLVDRLLASPQSAERCATDWLDLVRFAESNGFEMNQPRPDAWPYRDWVIEAFAQDRPWSEFVRAQLAGDRTGEDPATGLLVAGAWDQVKSPDPVLTAVQRDDELHGMVSVVSAAFLGLTVGCAKCHEHRFDPIQQSDYYALRACFEGVRFGSRAWPDSSAGPEAGLREPVNAGHNVERFEPVLARAVRFTVTATTGAEPCLDELEAFAGEAPLFEEGSISKGAVSKGAVSRGAVSRGPSVARSRNVALAANGAVASVSSLYPNDVHHQVPHLNDGIYGNAHSWIPSTVRSWARIDFAQAEWVESVEWARDREGVYADRVPTEYSVELLLDDGTWLEVASSEGRAPIAPARTVYSGSFDPSPPPTHRLGRGDPQSPREVVEPAGIASVDLPFPAFDQGDESARREALAEWIASPRNPLTPRVVVNRIWQQHFGRGLVATPSDLGAMGSRPTHPELLDTLALDFVETGMRPRSVHRRILLSQTYRQASAPRAKALAVDAEARFLWRFPARRLSGEAIRDSMLAVAGVLDETRGGPGFSLFRPNDNYVRVYEPKSEFAGEDFRRAIYATRVRMHPDPTFRPFDLPDGGQPCSRRERSTTPLQAFSLLHAPFVHEVAERFAATLTSELGEERAEDPGSFVARAFARAFQRDPEAEEVEACEALLALHGPAALCRSLLAASELCWLP